MKILKIKYIFVLCCLILFVGNTMGQSKDIKKCKSIIKGGKYKKISEARPIKGNVNILLTILVKPKNFNKIYMTKLAKRIKSVYCNENAVFTRVFDSYKSAALYFDVNYSDLNEKNEYEMVRGFYSFDREENKDILEFSKKLGNPTTEVEIDMSETELKENDTSKFNINYCDF